MISSIGAGGCLTRIFQTSFPVVEEDRHRDKQNPELKIIEDEDEVTRLESAKTEAQVPRKKAQLRRSQENDALLKSLSAKEEPELPTDDEPLPIKEPALESTASPMQIPPIVFILAAVVFIALLGFGMFMALGGKNRENRNQMQDLARESLKMRAQEKEDARQIVDNLLSALSQYTSASTVEEKLTHARQPQRVRPLMQKYYSNREFTPRSGARLINQYAIPLETSSFVGVIVAFDEGPTANYLAQINNDNSITIDWESDVCYQPIEISEYLRTKPTESVNLRVFATPDNYYVYEFCDSEEYLCVKLTFRDNDEILYGYLKKGTVALDEIQTFFQATQLLGSATTQPLFLQVRFLENSQSDRCVLIEKLIATRWANIDELKDEE